MQQANTFRSSLLVVASGLNHQNIQDLCFLHRDKICKQCTCRGQSGPDVATCPHHGGLNGVAVMETLLEKGVFSKTDTQPLTSMLKQVGRNDLANNFIEGYVEKNTSPIETATAVVQTACRSTTSPLNGNEPKAKDSARHVFDPVSIPQKPNLVTPRDPNRCTCKCTCDRRFLSCLEPDLQVDYVPLPSSNQQLSDIAQLRDCTIEHSSTSSLTQPTPTHPSPMTTHTSPSPAVCLAKCPCMCRSETPSIPERVSSPVELDSILTHSLPSSPVSKGCASAQSDKFTQSECLNPTGKQFEVPKAFIQEASCDPCLSDDEFVVVLNKFEINEVQKMLDKDSAMSTKSRQSLRQKMKTITNQKKILPRSRASTTKGNEGIDEFEIIEDEEILAIPSTLPPHHRFSARAFSLDSLKPKRTRTKVFDHRMSYPEMTQSCADFGGRGTSNSRATCAVCNPHSCGGACVHILQTTRRHTEMKDSMDSGMDSSQSIESAPSPINENHSSRPSRNQDVPMSDAKLTKNKDGGAGTRMIEWKISRDNFLDPIFHHKSKFFEKKVRISIGCGKSRLSVNLLVKLHPNGLGNDLGSFSTLTVEIAGMSPLRSQSTSVHCTFKGTDSNSQDVIVSRSVQHPLKDKSFTLTEFLSHEVIKVSSAKRFEFMLMFQIKTLINNEWVLVSTTENLEFNESD